MWLWAVLLICSVHGLLDEEFGSNSQGSSASTSGEELNTRCFQVESSACPPAYETCRCRRINAESAVCCDITRPFQIKEGLGCAAAGGDAIRKLHIQNATLPDLDDLSKLRLKYLESLTVSNGNLNRVGSAPHLSTLRCLDLDNSTIRDVGVDSFLHLTNLDYLGLGGLNLTKLPRVKINVTLNITGNNHLGCSMLLQYILNNTNLKFVEENTTYCSTLNTFHWFNSTDIIPLVQVLILVNLPDDCIPSCVCRSAKLDMMIGQPARVSVDVDCSNRGFTNLPSDLPTYTKSLNVSNNNITSLQALSNDDSYNNVRELYADNNLISSIVTLEGSKFIDTFQVLSLRDNRIKSLPTYIFSNTFDRNYATRTVNLGGNRFACNCSVAQVIKLWLTSNKKHIPDYDQVYCENSIDKVVELDVNKVCTYTKDWTDYIYYIIAAEVGLFVLLISKVSYDYWVFKTAGYLPWPASKMPKLPCDWVFE